jgi:hypothetical protein
MTGVPDFNRPLFHGVTARLRDAGFDVVNPAELDIEDNQETWADFLKRDIIALMDCDTIVMLPGWEDSRGARLERAVAHGLGMLVLERNPTIDDIAGVFQAERVH